MMKKTIWIGLLAGCFLMMGCDDSSDSDGTESGGTVNPGDTQKPDETQKPGETQKLGETQKPGESQDPNLTKADTVTTQKCDDNYDETCLDNVARFCNDDGFVVVRKCAELGDGSVCRKMAAENVVDCVLPCEKKSDETVCDGNKPVRHVCAKTTQGDKQLHLFKFSDAPCASACSDGKCVDKVDYEEGKPCGDDFVAACDGQVGYDCVGGTIAKRTCEGSKLCAIRVGGTTTMCAEKCDSVINSTEGICESVGGKTVAKRTICEPAIDHKYYAFEIEETCANDCAGGICGIKALPVDGDDCDEATFRSVCIEGEAYNCNPKTHKVEIIECGSREFVGQPFCRVKSDSYAGCVVPCAAGDAPLTNCGSRHEDGKKISYTDNFVCEKSPSDQGYYSFRVQEDCAGSCKSGVCI